MGRRKTYWELVADAKKKIRRMATRTIIKKRVYWDNDGKRWAKQELTRRSKLRIVK